LIDLTTDGLALSNSTAAIRSQYRNLQSTNHRLVRQIFDEGAPLRQNTVNGGFPGSLKGPPTTAGQPLNCIPLSNSTIGASAAVHVPEPAQLSTLPKAVR
jgi:hypothetical protein